jgi:putative membrane protein
MNQATEHGPARERRAHMPRWLRGTLMWTAAIVLLVGVMIWQGFSLADARQGFAAAGVAGVATITLFHLVPLVLDSIAWQLLLPPGNSLSLAQACFARWIGEAVSALVPASTVGGELARARVAAVISLPMPVAGASVLVDLTLATVTQVVFSIAGVAALFVLSGDGGGLASQIAIGVTVFGVLIAGFLAIQLGSPLRRLAGLLGPMVGERARDRMIHNARLADGVLTAIYARHHSLILSAAWRLLGWVAGAGEFWLGLRFLGHPIGLVEAVMIESLVQAARSAAFLVPAGFGVQEATLVGLGATIGVPAEAALALSLLKRSRELLLGLPGLVAWTLLERRGRQAA